MLAKSFAKVRGFFLTTKFFRSFFEKIFQRSETGTGSPSRSLSTAKVRYKATTEKPETSRSLCQCFTAFLSRKRVQNYALFRKLQLLHDFFLTFPESFFVKRWKTGMLRGIFLPEIHHIITNTISTSPNSSSTFQRTFYCVQNKSS